MKTQNSGHIINIGSIAGLYPYKNGSIYCATKAAVHSLSQTMRADLLENSIKVTDIEPGAVETNFSNIRFKGDTQKADNVYKGYIPLIADDIADSIYYCASLPFHVYINKLEICPTAQASAYYFHKK